MDSGYNSSAECQKKKNVGWSSIYKKQRNFSNMKGIIHLEKIQSA
jgi:hypothetical protein